MPDLGHLDLDEIATALADQTDYERRWLINPTTGEVVLWTFDTGIDGHNPVDLDDLDLVCIDALPSYVWYQDMADFVEGINDEQARRRLARAIDGLRAFRRFKAELHDEFPHLLPTWYAFHDARAQRRAVGGATALQIAPGRGPVTPQPPRPPHRVAPGCARRPVRRRSMQPQHLG